MPTDDDDDLNWDDLENPLGLSPETLDRLYSIFGTADVENLIVGWDAVEPKNIRGFIATSVSDVVEFLTDIGVIGYEDVFIVELGDGYYTASIPTD